MLSLQQHTIPVGSTPARLVDYALAVFPAIASRSSLKRIIKRGELLVDGVPGQTGTWLREGQQLNWVDSELNPPKALDIELDVVYEDEHLAVINKPPGIEVSGNKYYTIQNALIGTIGISRQTDALKWPRPAHRLDSPTSGLLLVSKTAATHMKLGQMLEKRQIQKTYVAIVAGKLPPSGRISTPVGDQQALTTYTRLSYNPSLKSGHLSMAALQPHTGRTHQLRIHLADMGFPIVGDKLYGEGPMLRGKGLFLAAVGIEMLHPFDQSALEIGIPYPKKFDSLIARETRRWMQFNGNEEG